MFQPTPLVRMSYQAFGNNSPPFYCPKSSARRESFIVPIHLLWSNQAASAPSLFVNLYICETVMMLWLDYLPIWYLFMNRFVNCNVTCYVHVMWVLFLWCDLLWTCDLSFVSEPVFCLRSKSGFIHIYFFKWPIVISDGQKQYASPISYNGDAKVHSRHLYNLMVTRESTQLSPFTVIGDACNLHPSPISIIGDAQNKKPSLVLVLSDA